MAGAYKLGASCCINRVRHLAGKKALIYKLVQLVLVVGKVGAHLLWAAGKRGGAYGLVRVLRITFAFENTERGTYGLFEL